LADIRKTGDREEKAVRRGTTEDRGSKVRLCIRLGGHNVIKIHRMIENPEDWIGMRARINLLDFDKADVYINPVDVTQPKVRLDGQPQVNL